MLKYYIRDIWRCVILPKLGQRRHFITILFYILINIIDLNLNINIVPYYTVLYRTASNCIVMYCTVSYCIVLYCTILYLNLLYCTVLYCTVLYRTVSNCIVMYWTESYIIELYYTIHQFWFTIVETCQNCESWLL